MRGLSVSLLLIFGSIFITSCSNLEDDIIGKWQMNDDCDPDFDEGTVNFTDEGTVTGIEGYTSYELIENDDKQSGDLVLKSGVDNRLLKIDLDGDKMKIAEEGSAFTCKVDRVD